MRMFLSFLVLAIGTNATTAFAQERGQLQKIQALIACQDIQQDSDRLRCFDATVQSFSEATESGEIVTVEKATIKEIEKDSFGFNLPSVPKLSRLLGLSKAAKKVEEVKTPKPSKDAALSVESPVPDVKSVEKKRPAKVKFEDTKLVELTIKSVKPFGRDKLKFYFENGQVWEQTEAKHLNKVKLGGGKKVTAVIRKKALGSFFLRVNGKGSAIKVRRVR